MPGTGVALPYFVLDRFHSLRHGAGEKRHSARSGTRAELGRSVVCGINLWVGGTPVIGLPRSDRPAIFRVTDTNTRADETKPWA